MTQLIVSLFIAMFTVGCTVSSVDRHNGTQFFHSNLSKEHTAIFVGACDEWRAATGVLDPQLTERDGTAINYLEATDVEYSYGWLGLYRAGEIKIRRDLYDPHRILLHELGHAWGLRDGESPLMSSGPGCIDAQTLAAICRFYDCVDPHPTCA